jgi:hypothetical protein
MRRETQEDHFIVRAFKNALPTIISVGIGAAITIFTMRTDYAVMDQRVIAVESTYVTRDVVTARFDGLDDKIESLKSMITGLSAKLDAHIMK